MDGSNGNTKMLDVLERIASSVEQLNGRVDTLTARVDTLSERVERGFTSVNGRLDHMIMFMGGRHADHEERIQALEELVFKKPKPD